MNVCSDWPEVVLLLGGGLLFVVLIGWILYLAANTK